jgi:hypothetical protein
MFTTMISESDRVTYRGVQCRLSAIMSDESRDFATLFEGPHYEQRPCDARPVALWGNSVTIEPSRIVQTSRVIATYNDGTVLYEHELVDIN